jgi:pimeloyl-ACP methyl ester carboxylesterase
VELSELPPVTGITHRFVQAGDVKLHVAEAGEGPPLLLLHGWPQHWWCWRFLIPRLAASYRVIAPDLRGMGFSEAPSGRYATATLAADIIALIDAEGLERVRVISHDWGAYISFLMALEHPERIERLVALDILPPWPAAARRRPSALLQMLAYQGPVATPVLGPLTMTLSPVPVRTVIRKGSGPGRRWSDDELDVYADVLREPARAKASSALYRTFLTRELPASTRSKQNPERIDVPTLLLMGGASLLRALLAPMTVGNLEVREIEGAGHFLPEEAPEKLLALALPFLSA